MSETATTELHCERHGPYLGQEAHIFGKSFKSACPECSRQQAQQEQRERDSLQLINAKKRVTNLAFASGLPKRFKDRTFENYRVENQYQQANKTAIQRYAKNFDEVLRNGAGLVLCGKPGTGKTHLSAALANHVIATFGRRAKFMTVMDLVRSTRSTMSKDSDTTEEAVINRLLVPDLLILDEVGVQLGTNYELVTITDLLNKRYNEMRPTVLISNLERDELTRYVGERVMSRMTEGGGAILSFTWESYRDRVAADANLPKAKVVDVDWTDPAHPE